MRFIDSDIKAYNDLSIDVVRKNISYLAFFILLSISVAACSLSNGGDRPSEDVYSVDPLFRSFYNDLGGQERIGPAISPAFESEGVLYQYTESALMRYDGGQPSDQRFQLAPLGVEMGIYEIPESGPERNDRMYIGGHPIYPKFEALYEELGGIGIVGEPLTRVHKNERKQRYEQYFENLGFYWIEGDPDQEAHLLAYGAWKCGFSCRDTAPSNSRVVLPSRTAAPFVKTASKYGLSFTGYAISEPFIGSDGNLEQIYENIVFFANPEHPDQVNLRSVALILDVPQDDPEAPSDDPDMHFYPIGSGLGYNIPVEFMDFVSHRGGFEISGPPVSHLNQIDESTFRQCFRNICLELQKGDQNQAVVQAVPLGYTYKEFYYQPLEDLDSLASGTEVSLQVWENYPMISPGQEQEVGVALFAGGEPLANVSPELILTLPDGSKESYRLPQTGEDGRSQYRLDSISAENGTLIPYQVCVDTPDGPRFCVIDSYLIWEADFVTVSTPQPPQFQTHIPLILRNIKIYMPALVDQLEDVFLPLVAK